MKIFDSCSLYNEDHNYLLRLRPLPWCQKLHGDTWPCSLWWALEAIHQGSLTLILTLTHGNGLTPDYLNTTACSHYLANFQRTLYVFRHFWSSTLFIYIVITVSVQSKLKLIAVYTGRTWKCFLSSVLAVKIKHDCEIIKVDGEIILGINIWTYSLCFLIKKIIVKIKSTNGPLRRYKMSLSWLTI